MLTNPDPAASWERQETSDCIQKSLPNSESFSSISTIASQHLASRAQSPSPTHPSLPTYPTTQIKESANLVMHLNQNLHSHSHTTLQYIPNQDLTLPTHSTSHPHQEYTEHDQKYTYQDNHYDLNQYSLCDDSHSNLYQQQFYPHLEHQSSHPQEFYNSDAHNPYATDPSNHYLDQEYLSQFDQDYQTLSPYSKFAQDQHHALEIIRSQPYSINGMGASQIPSFISEGSYYGGVGNESRELTSAKVVRTNAKTKKLAQRMDKNKEAAKRNRLKKKEYIHSLEHSYAQTQSHLAHLSQEIIRLEGEFLDIQGKLRGKGYLLTNVPHFAEIMEGLGEDARAKMKMMDDEAARKKLFSVDAMQKDTVDIEIVKKADVKE